MIPGYFVQLEKMPRTNNNKIDKKRLPNPEGLGLESGVEYVEPRNEIDETLVKIWEVVLEKEKIGIKDDFFDLGGHSLKVVQVLSKIQKAFDVKIEMSKIFELTTIEQIGDFISLVAWDYSDAESEMEDFTI
jgi:acyl carrier protein